MKIFLCIAILWLAAALVSGCGSHDSSTKTDVMADSARPDSEMRGATINLLEGKQVKTRINAERVVKYEALDSTMGYQVDADFFDSVGSVSSELTGDSALIREVTKHLYVYGRVVVVSEDGSRLETDYLHWNPDIQKIQTDSFVKLTTKGDVLTGWGFEANQKLTRFKILRQVSGTVHNRDDLGID